MQGGELGWSDPNVYVPEFRDMVNRHCNRVSSASPSAPHGWHIGAAGRSPQPGCHRQRQEQRAYQLIFNRRFTEESQAWLDELRDEAYIQIDPINGR